MSYQLWNTCRTFNITPNQLYFLDCCREKIIPSKVINADAEKLMALQAGYIDLEGNLSQGAIVILNDFETFLVKTNKKVTKEVLGDDFMENVKFYRELFPAKKLPSGELARQTPKELKDRFVWFFKSYPEYDWALALDAASFYLYNKRMKNFEYTMTSSYFIKKTDPRTKETSSKLADYCQLLLDDPNLLNFS